MVYQKPAGEQKKQHQRLLKRTASLWLITKRLGFPPDRRATIDLSRNAGVVAGF